MGLNSLKDVLTEQLEDLYSAETQLVTALPKMEKAATHDELKTAFKEHLEETKGHVKRVEEALGELGASPGTEECKGMKGLITEGEEVMQDDRRPDREGRRHHRRRPARRALRDRGVGHRPPAREGAAASTGSRTSPTRRSTRSPRPTSS